MLAYPPPHAVRLREQKTAIVRIGCVNLLHTQGPFVSGSHPALSVPDRSACQSAWSALTQLTSQVFPPLYSNPGSLGCVTVATRRIIRAAAAWPAQLASALQAACSA